MEKKEHEDTIALLKECNAGAKMAVNSMKEVVDRIQNADMKEKLEKSMKKHEEIGDKTHACLRTLCEDDKEPQPVADAMSWLKIHVKLTMNPSDHEIADLMIDGCNMGIKSISEYLNKYQSANQETRNLVQSLVELEKKLMEELRVYL